MDRLERLLNLVAVLLDTERPLTAETLGTRVPGYPEVHTPTFKRAFERDKASLRAMGVPIEVIALEPNNPESPQGYRVRPSRYELPDLDLTSEEIAALHLAAAQVRLEGGDAAAAIWKLGGVAGGVEALARASTAALPGSDHLSPLFTAMAERRLATFRYRGMLRTVEPWRLEFRYGGWYLIGLDQGHGEQRSFRLDRFEDAPEIGEPGAFPPPAAPGAMTTHPWEMGDEEPVDVVVRVDADQAAWAATNAGVDAVQERGGTATLTLRVTNRAGLRSWVLNFLDRAEILAPPEERAAMVAWLEALT